VPQLMSNSIYLVKTSGLRLFDLHLITTSKYLNSQSLDITLQPRANVTCDQINHYVLLHIISLGKYHPVLLHSLFYDEFQFFLLIFLPLFQIPQIFGNLQFKFLYQRLHITMFGVSPLCHRPLKQSKFTTGVFCKHIKSQNSCPYTMHVIVYIFQSPTFAAVASFLEHFNQSIAQIFCTIIKFFGRSFVAPLNLL
jgi:hypothetical protein